MENAELRFSRCNTDPIESEFLEHDKSKVEFGKPGVFGIDGYDILLSDLGVVEGFRDDDALEFGEALGVFGIVGVIAAVGVLEAVEEIGNRKSFNGVSGDDGAVEDRELSF